MGLDVVVHERVEFVCPIDAMPIESYDLCFVYTDNALHRAHLAELKPDAIYEASGGMCLPMVTYGRYHDFLDAVCQVAFGCTREQYLEVDDMDRPLALWMTFYTSSDGVMGSGACALLTRQCMELDALMKEQLHPVYYDLWCEFTKAWSFAADSGGCVEFT